MLDLLLLPLLEAPQSTFPIVEPIAIVEQVPPEPTLEEKIATNYYKCDTNTHWIRADNAECLIKHQTTQTTKTRTRSSENASGGWFPYGECTWYVSTRRPVGKWNDATDWKWQAKRDGYTVSSVPVAGAIGWTYGHVVYSERVEGDRVLISEANYDWRGSIRTIWVDATKYTWIY